jgi:pyruvyl transferase EpsO
MTALAERVASLRQSAERRIRSVIGSQPVTALVDFPNYPNVGDSAIYVGQLACLDSLKIPRPRLICDFRTYDRRALGRAAGDGVILLTGGGSFGDLWPIGQECREEILRAFPDNRVIQLPQSIHFARRDSLDSARRAVNGHRNFVLLCRDQRSLDTARRNFDATTELCPDMAFCLGSIARPRPATKQIVWLLRKDKESALTPPDTSLASIVDWLDEPETLQRRMNYKLMGATLRRPTNRMWRSLLMQTYAPLARQRLHRGLNILSAGKVVITDRLHGYILSMLLGIPSVIIDNSYGKLTSFHSTWTSGLDSIQVAKSPDEALELATNLLAMNLLA